MRSYEIRSQIRALIGCGRDRTGLLEEDADGEALDAREAAGHHPLMTQPLVELHGGCVVLKVWWCGISLTCGASSAPRAPSPGTHSRVAQDSRDTHTYRCGPPVVEGG